MSSGNRFHFWLIPGSLLCLGLLSSSALADFMTGFESDEGYVGAPGSAGTTGGASQLIPQNGWFKQFGNDFDVHTYAGVQIPWTPPSRGPELYPVAPKTFPLNPNGGEQFIALGTSDGGGGGRDQIAVTYSAELVEVSVDFCNASEHDFPNYQGSILARDAGGHMVGIYTSAGSDEPLLQPLDPPNSGPWAVSVLAYDAVGEELDEDILDRFYRFDGVEGFDNLPRESWHRIGFVMDLDPASPSFRQITQLKTQDLTTGQIWIMDNPRAFAGTPRESPMHLRGGATGTEVPDLLGLYNVGNGQISMFDNVYVGPPYDWSRPGGARPQLQVTHEPAADTLSIAWESQAGMLYTLRSVVDPSSTDPKDWPIYDGNMDLTPTPPTNTLTIPLPPETIRLFVVEEFPAPPVTVFSDNFEDGQGDWTTGGDDGSNPFTNWEFGSPTVVGPASANSGANCFGTNLSADYANLSDLWLRSPPIDLTAAAGATLNFSHYVDIEEGFDFGEVRLLDAEAALAELAVLEMTIDGNNPTGWEPFSKALPAAALGKNVVLEFRFDSDDISEPTQAGWYIDDVVVTTPAP